MISRFRPLALGLANAAAPASFVHNNSLALRSFSPVDFDVVVGLYRCFATAVSAKEVPVARPIRRVKGTEPLAEVGQFFAVVHFLHFFAVIFQILLVG